MAFKTHRQSYVNCTYETARAAGWDTVQLKYCGEYKLFDEGGTGTCVLLGDAFTGPRWAGTDLENRLLVWDCLVSDGKDLRGIDYRNRFSFARLHCQRLGAFFKIVTPYPIQAAPELWKQRPVGTVGLVYRNSKAAYGEPLCVARRYDETPGDIP